MELIVDLMYNCKQISCGNQINLFRINLNYLNQMQDFSFAPGQDMMRDIDVQGLSIGSQIIEPGDLLGHRGDEHGRPLLGDGGQSATRSATAVAGRGQGEAVFGGRHPPIGLTTHFK